MVTITAGNSFLFTHSSEYRAADGWALSFNLISADTNMALTGTDTASGWTFSAAPDATAKWKPGIYGYRITARDGTDRNLDGGGMIEVLPDPETAVFDPRTFPQKMVDAIDAALLGDANDEQLGILEQRHGITDIKQDSEKLVRLRGIWAGQAAVDSGKANPYRIKGRSMAR